MKLHGKRLLIMGGPALASEIVKTAQNMGIYTLVTDWYPLSKSPAKEVANDYSMVSTSDVKAILKLIDKEKIDGVITGFTDSTLQYYEQVCTLSGLHCYTTANQIKILTDKIKFKKLCKDFGVPVVEEYNITQENIKDQIDAIKFPVIIKPNDNSGARGISICNHKDEFLKAYDKALKFSNSKKVITERYINAEEATIFYYLNKGEIILTGIGDRHIKNNQKGVIPLPVAYTFPSKHLSTYIKELNQKVITMFKSIGMTDGIVFIQSIVENDKFIFYEMGFRLTGSLEYKLMEAILGINPLKMIIEFSLTGDVSTGKEFQDLNPYWHQYGCNITLLSRPGQIGKIIGVDDVLSIPEVLDIFYSYKAGDIIPETAIGTLQQVVLRIFGIANSKKELAILMDRIHDKIKVVSIDNENLLLDKFDTKDFYNES